MIDLIIRIKQYIKNWIIDKYNNKYKVVDIFNIK